MVTSQSHRRVHVTSCIFFCMLLIFLIVILFEKNQLIYFYQRLYYIPEYINTPSTGEYKIHLKWTLCDEQWPQ